MGNALWPVGNVTRDTDNVIRDADNAIGAGEGSDRRGRERKCQLARAAGAGTSFPD
jgi:hypothetical protein